MSDVIFRAAVGLHAFAVFRADFVNVSRNRRRADKRNRLHLRMREQRVHDFASAVNDVQHAFRQSGLFEQLRDFDGGERDFFARLEHERVAAGDGDGIHPQRHHAGKIERRDAGTDAERLADGFAINAARDVLQHLAHHQRRHAAGELDHFHAALHVAARFDERFAVLARVAAHEVLEIFLQQHFEFEEYPRAFDRRRFHPAWKRGGGGFDGSVHVGCGADGTFGDDFADGWIENRRACNFRLKPFTADEIGTGFKSGKHIKKLQAPSSNIQRSSKLQSPIPTLRCPFWSLVLGASLELGCWSLDGSFPKDAGKNQMQFLRLAINWRASSASLGSDAAIIRRKNFVSFASLTQRPMVFLKSFFETPSFPSQ